MKAGVDILVKQKGGPTRKETIVAVIGNMLRLLQLVIIKLIILELDMVQQNTPVTVEPFIAKFEGVAASKVSVVAEVPVGGDLGSPLFPCVLSD